MRDEAWVAWRAPVSWALLTGGLHLLPAGSGMVPGSGWFEDLHVALPFLDKVAHVVLFSVLAFLTRRGLQRAGVRRAVGLAIGLSVAYGLLLEQAQEMVPGRTGEAFDALADVFGACVGAILTPDASRETTLRMPSRRPDETP